MYRATIASAILAVMVLTSVSASANDKEGVYVTVGGTLLSADLDLSGLEAAGQTVDLGEEDADIFMINGRVGYRFNDYFAVEGEIGFGTGGDDFDRTIPVDGGALGIIDVDANVELDVDNYYIGFAKQMQRQRLSRVHLVKPHLHLHPKMSLVLPMVLAGSIILRKKTEFGQTSHFWMMSILFHWLILVVSKLD